MKVEAAGPSTGPGIEPGTASAKWDSVRKSRIVHVLGAPNIGGVETHALAIIKNHDSRRVEPHVVFLTSPKGRLESDFRAIAQVHFCEYRPGRRASFILRLAYLLLRLRASAVLCHAFGLHALVSVAARIALVRKVVVTIQNARPERSRLVVARKAARIARAFGVVEVAPSMHVRREIRTLYGAGRDDALIPNGLDLLPRSAPNASQSIAAAHRAGPLIGTIARMDPIKDHENLIRAFAHVAMAVPTARLVLVGDGPTRTEIERLLAKFGLRESVDLLGDVRDAKALLPQWDIFAFATSEDEGFGVAITEAMAAGLPIVATDIGPCREVLGNGECGVLVPPRDPQAMAAAMIALWKDEERRMELGKRAREFALANYDAKITTRKYEALLGINGA
ncbi:MAG: glycosyltransferase [Euryarchaeota archaeon]|nr:glycosyltransferase [Euryarchaeota archaeon]